MTNLLQKALEHHQAGRLPEAEQAYRALLRRRPSDPDALHYLGLAIFHLGRHEQGLASVQRSLRHAPTNPHAWNNLGNLLLLLDRLTESHAAYCRAIELAPQLHQAWYNRGVICRRLRRSEEALTCFRRAVELSPRYEHAYESLGMLYYRLGEVESAHRAYADWLKVAPDNPVARHMLAATAPAGAVAPARADDAYIRTVFDGFAETFDSNLASLGYRAPELVAAALQEHSLYQSGRAEVADLGCGTGLCGPLLRSSARRLVGVDLSPEMLARARARAVYDELVEADLVAALRAAPDAFDLIVSADTLVYFGDLTEVAAAVAGALRRGGSVAFTVEALDEPGDDTPYRIQPNGRYRHRPAYVRNLLLLQGLGSITLTPAELRREKGEPVRGLVCCAQRPPAR